MRALSLLLLLAACGPLVQIGGNDKPPVALMTLRATVAPSVGTPVEGQPLIVSIPVVPGPLQTLRLPVIVADTELAYLAGATWAEQPNRQFQRLLADTVAAGGLPVMDPRSAANAPHRTLSGQLVEFALDVRQPARPEVRIRYDAVLIGADGKPQRTRRFAASQPVASQVPADVALALNAVANTVAGDVAAWVGR